MSEPSPAWQDPPVTHLPLCPVLMHEDKFCGRPLHAAPQHDPIPVCLMHSLDPAKDDTQFQQEIDTIVVASAMVTGIADFSRFVFPTSQYMVRAFPARCIFRNAIFWKEANFYSANFEHGADFESAHFENEASFTRAKFGAKANFHSAVFKGDTHFATDFAHEVTFVMAHFAQEAGFYNSSFAADATFGSVKFEGKAVFSRAVFNKKADFGNAGFLQEAFFPVATFEQEADFMWAHFTLNVDFEHTTFKKAVIFHEAVFHAGVEFRETQFRNDGEPLPGPIFSLAQFMAPETAVFYRTYLGQALFYTCDVSRLTFSSVHWRKRPNGKYQLFEEVVDLSAAGDLAPGPDDPNERDYGLIAETYQQLKKNYDNRQDYWTAGDFHYGEMEMKRLHSPRKNNLARWLHRNLGLVAWYRYASEYGESYVRPLLALAAILAVFTLLFPIPGMVFTKPDTPNTPPSFPVLNYSDFSAYIRAYKGPAWIGTLAFFGHSLMTALSVAGFQKELIYQPAYPWGRALALLELLLTSTLIALFLLALRRQFRR
ncbi:pentapeptide repeat-containing protein [Alloacidobacterium dinghuense]|uniref:Pentapeptide repeat-containing protein n=1 Tax=Alloacidobacterium dinghuense TaxID=2763107 RepID=A0A7G8BMF2_9BACT|nr:pentapeptide repeat-containing protein [Alloacidobacterium dinghuense]QNI33722.1 pentapeptide repeat-containing protein [Alloacidobacterium dinghuense]